MTGLVSAYELGAALTFAVFLWFTLISHLRSLSWSDRLRLVAVSAIVGALWPVFLVYLGCLRALRAWLDREAW